MNYHFQQSSGSRDVSCCLFGRGVTHECGSLVPAKPLRVTGRSAASYHSTWSSELCDRISASVKSMNHSCNEWELGPQALLHLSACS